MSISSKQGGGSRASDDDSKTSVKVGRCSTALPFQVSGTREHFVTDVRCDYSRSSAPASATDRSRLREYTTALSTIRRPQHISDKLSCRVTTGSKAFRV